MQQTHQNHIQAKAMVASLLLIVGAAHGQTLPPEDHAPGDTLSAGTAPPGLKNGYAEQLVRKTKSAAASARPPYAPVQKTPEDAAVPEIEMFVGESRVFPAPGVGRIAVGNGSILTAAALDGKEVILFANGMGTSSLFIWNDDGRYQRIKINIVPGDTSRIAREISQFLKNIPNARSSIVGDKVIVEGDDLSNAELERVAVMAKRYPQIINFTNQIGFEKMVMIDVKVVEFPVNYLKEIGLKWSSAGGVAIGAVWQPLQRSNGSYQISQNPAGPIINANGSTPVIGTSSFNIRSLLNLGLNATLNALEQQGKSTVLAEPQLSVRNGSVGEFLAGGEFPYSVATLNGPAIQFKPYGIKLNIKPRVDPTGTIRSEIDTEFSQIDGSVSTTSGPALLTRKTKTEFNVKSGETIILSGLIQRDNTSSVDKVPLLSQIPVLGALFQSKRYQNKETELVIFVTPSVVDSQSPSSVDRLKQVKERLHDNLGPQPHLSQPLQPKRPAEQPDWTPPPPPTQPSVQSESQAQPPHPTAALEAAPVPKPLQQIDTLGEPLRFKVTLNGLPLRAEPSVNGKVIQKIGTGSIVEQAPQPYDVDDLQHWTYVQAGASLGWVATEWLEKTTELTVFAPYYPTADTNP